MKISRRYLHHGDKIAGKVFWGRVALLGISGGLYQVRLALTLITGPAFEENPNDGRE